MTSRKFWVPSLLVLFAAVGVFVVLGAPSDRATGNPGQAGVEDWPYNIACPAGDPSNKASGRLQQLHDLAVTTLGACAPTDPRVNDIKLVLTRAWTCATFDSVTASGPHATGHAGAATGLWTAYQNLFTAGGVAKPEADQDWAGCASGLNHGH